MLYSKCRPVLYVYVINTVEVGQDNAIVASQFNLNPQHLTEHC